MEMVMKARGVFFKATRGRENAQGQVQAADRPDAGVRQAHA